MPKFVLNTHILFLLFYLFFIFICYIDRNRIRICVSLNVQFVVKLTIVVIIIIVIIALLWDQKVFEKKGEKIDKYQDLKREIGNLWGIRQQEVALVVVGALRLVCKRWDTWLGKLGITIMMGLL